MNNLENLTEEISVDKEILNTLPQNNKKNVKIYLDKINELSEKYKTYEKDILNEIKMRARKFDDIKPSEKLDALKDEVKESESTLYLLNDVDSPYEKMHLDKEMSTLTYYYKKDLERVNATIAYCIKKFKEIGIELTPNDFSFNKYVNEYVSYIYRGIGNNELNKTKINSKFEEIYWKCPEIITYIELNIRYLYLKNEKEIDKYYKNQKRELVKNFPKEVIQENYCELKKNLIESTKKDEYLLVRQFLDGKLLAKDYTKEAILDVIYKFTNRKDLNEISDEELNEILINLMKLLNTIREYKNYNKFKFIIDSVKSIYAEKDKYKGAFAKSKKDVMQKETEILKLGKPKLLKKSNDKNLAKQTKLILELKEQYKEFDNNEVREKVTTVLNENSTLYDVLYLASSFYKYLFLCITKDNKEIQENEINQLIDELKEFLNWPYFTILNNIVIDEKKDILYIIKDRYNLLNINISKEDLDIGNLDSLINTLTRCDTYYYLKENNIDIQEISDVYEFKKILKNI